MWFSQKYCSCFIPKKLKLKSTITWYGDENDPDRITKKANEVIADMVTNSRKSISHLADGAFRKFINQILPSISFDISQHSISKCISNINIVVFLCKNLIYSWLQTCWCWGNFSINTSIANSEWNRRQRNESTSSATSYHSRNRRKTVQFEMGEFL